MTDLSQLQHFPLKGAYLCLEHDCGHVHNSNSYCPACASTQIKPLTTWIAELLSRVEETCKS